MDISDLISGKCQIQKPDAAVYCEVKERWDAAAKPLDSLGVFEDAAARIGSISGTSDVDIKKRAVIVMCADNGIVDEGVSQCGQEVTLAVARAMGRGVSSVCKMAALTQTEVLPVDIGINSGKRIAGVLQRKVRRGTRNFIVEPAMTKEETLMAMRVGFDEAIKAAEAGCRLICLGEMGIGNTATSAALVAAIAKRSASETAGRGSGLDDAHLAKKVRVIDEAIKKYDLYSASAMDVLAAVGGLDTAGMIGVMAGAAVHKTPVVLDGVVSCAAALAAERIIPGIKDHLIASHTSMEPSAKIALDILGLCPVIDAKLALGEGTGAVMFCALLDHALTIYSDVLTFDDIKVKRYTRFC